MMKTSTPEEKKKLAEDMMVDLMYGIAETLLKKIQEGTASHQDISNAIKLLKDNGINVSVNKGTPLAILAEELPFQSDHLLS